MLCHQHSSEAAHAACQRCQRCQRGLCRSCSQQFLQRVCTHCIEQTVSQRTREGRRTLWLTLPVFALPAWATVMALSSTPARLYFGQLAGMLALGVWFGLRRWRRAPGLASDVASIPDGGTILVPVLAGVAFWPWLMVETLRDISLANQLRTYVPEEQRASTFGFGEASLVFASVASAFTLGAHGLSSTTPLAGKLWATEAGMVDSAQEAVRSKLARQETAARAPAAAPVPDGVEAPQLEAPQVEAPQLEAPQVEAPRAEAPPHAEASPPVEVPPLPEVPSEARASTEIAVKEVHGKRHRRRGEVAVVEEAAPVPQVEVAEPEEQAPAAEPAVEAPKPAPTLDRRYVPGSEMAKQALSGKKTPDGSYVTSSGRVVIKAPPLAK